MKGKKMFYVEVHVRPKYGHTRGLLALDERRRLGLKDGTRVLENSVAGNIKLPTFTVSETFARDRAERFNYKDTVHIIVDLEDLNKGEVVLHHGGIVGVSEDLPEWRLVELWPVDAKTEQVNGRLDIIKNKE